MFDLRFCVFRFVVFAFVVFWWGLPSSCVFVVVCVRGVRFVFVRVFVAFCVWCVCMYVCLSVRVCECLCMFVVVCVCVCGCVFVCVCAFSCKTQM